MIDDAAERLQRLANGEKMASVYGLVRELLNNWHSDQLAVIAEYLSVREELSTLREQTRWIAVGEMLPEPDKPVLALCDSGHIKPEDRWWRGSAKITRHANGDISFWSIPGTWRIYPTHWCELPPPPEPTT